MAVSVVSVRRVVCIVGLVLLAVGVRPATAAASTCHSCNATVPGEPFNACKTINEATTPVTVACDEGKSCYEITALIGGNPAVERGCDGGATKCTGESVTTKFISYPGKVAGINDLPEKAQIKCCLAATANCNSDILETLAAAQDQIVNDTANGTHATPTGLSAAVQPLNLIAIYAVGLLSFYVGGLAL